jgi:ABC-type multidrug transport system fused ATPase/permease subunit
MKRSFWTFARRMLRHRRALIPALVMAAISAGGLGAGLLAVIPVLRHLFPTGEEAERNLRQMATEWSAKLQESAGVALPQNLIEALPTGRFTSIVWIMAGLGLLTMLGATANYLHAYWSLTVISRTVADIRRDVYRRVIHLPLKTVIARGSTDLISRIVFDTQTLAAGFNALLSRGVAQVTKGAAALGAAFVINWRLAAIAAGIGVLLGILIRKLGKTIRRASRKALAEQANLYRAASEALSAAGLRVVKVSTTEREEAARFHQINKAVVGQEFKVRTARALASPLVEVIALFVLGFLVLIAAKAVDDGHLDPTDLLAVLGSLAIAGASLKPLTGIMNDIQQSSAAADRLRELLELEVEPGHGHELPELARHEKSVGFENVTFSYPGANEAALKGVTLEIPCGQSVAFVGPNGSGKTTLLSLVARLFDPEEGRVLVDGRDIREVSVRSLRRQIAVVTQETVLLAGTVRSNIAYGSEEGVEAWGREGVGDTREGQRDRGTEGQREGMEERVRAAARRARAEEFILVRPGGYDSPIGEGGTGLSGGQKQRIAIARAIMRDPRILILDEATSMVDAESEGKIAEAIAEFVAHRENGGRGGAEARGRGVTEASAGRTCLVVAHRLSTVMNADRIVVMDQGRIVDDGTHEELLARCEVYGSIARTQLIGGGAGNGLKVEARQVGQVGCTEPEVRPA